MQSHENIPIPQTGQAEPGADKPVFTVAVAQGIFRVGTVQSNRDRVAAFHALSSKIQADLLILPEMVLTGYPAQDLLFERDFLAAQDAALADCTALTAHGCAMLLGAVRRQDGELRNSAFLMDQGRITGFQDKRMLPNRGVFDERRYFTPGTASQVLTVKGVRVGILICEDAWTSEAARELAALGAELLICLNASPFETGKQAQREAICRARVDESGLPMIYVNLVASQDDLLFDGSSFVMNGDGRLASRLAAFREDFGMLRLLKNEGRYQAHAVTLPDAVEQGDALLYHALVFGLREFAVRNGYKGAVLGLSGGIDSAICAAIAVDAFGAGNVQALFLPSPITSSESRTDAFACAARLGISIREMPIQGAMKAFADLIGTVPDHVHEENQTRIRASLLLGVARSTDSLLLNTGNKSEMAVGYTTLYGDLCGHYAPLKDLYKKTVYRLAIWRNTRGDPIPERILLKPPSAELFAGQRDEDVLPPYPVLDAILENLLEGGLTGAEVVARGFDAAVVQEVQRLLDVAEQKRYQAPPGPKLSTRALTNERRFPITNGWCVERKRANGGVAEPGL